MVTETAEQAIMRRYAALRRARDATWETAKHWLTVARVGCMWGCDSETARLVLGCRHELEHQRTATLLQREVEPLEARVIELVTERDELVEALHTLLDEAPVVP